MRITNIRPSEVEKSQYAGYQKSIDLRLQKANKAFEKETEIIKSYASKYETTINEGQANRPLDWIGFEYYF